MTRNERGGVSRLVFAQNSWIDVERVGGLVVGGTFPNMLGMYVVWSSVEPGRAVEYVAPDDAENFVRVSGIPLAAKQAIH